MRAPLGGITYDVTLFDGRLASQVDIVLVDAPGFFDRPGVYGERGEDYPDNAVRFALLSYASAELARQRAAGGAPYDVLHCHDWPASLVPTYLRRMTQETPELAATKTVLTLHNVVPPGHASVASRRAPVGTSKPPGRDARARGSSTAS